MNPRPAVFFLPALAAPPPPLVLAPAPIPPPPPLNAQTMPQTHPPLDVAAFRLARGGKFAEAFAILKLNEEQFPTSSNLATFRANINLLKGDTTAAIASFREAIRRDSTNGEAQGRLRQLTRP